MCHEVLDEGAIFFLLSRNSAICSSEKGGPFAELNAAVSSFFDSVHLTLSADFCLELSNSAQHVEEKPPGVASEVSMC